MSARVFRAPALLGLACAGWLQAAPDEAARLELDPAWRTGALERAAELVAHAEREPLVLEVTVGEERTRQALGGTISVQDLRVELRERPLADGEGVQARELCFGRVERTRASRAGDQDLAPPRSERSALADRCLRLERAPGAAWTVEAAGEPLPEGLDASALATLFDPARLLPARAQAPGERWTLALSDLRALLLPSTTGLGLEAPAGEADRALADAFEASLSATLEARYEEPTERDGRRVARVALSGELSAGAELEAPPGIGRTLSERSTLAGTLWWDLERDRPLELELERRGELRLAERLAAAELPTRRETQVKVLESRRLRWR